MGVIHTRQAPGCASQETKTVEPTMSLKNNTTASYMEGFTTRRRLLFVIVAAVLAWRSHHAVRTIRTHMIGLQARLGSKDAEISPSPNVCTAKQQNQEVLVKQWYEYYNSQNYSNDFHHISNRSTSMEWWYHERIGNSDVNMTNRFVEGMILGYLMFDNLSFVLQQSLCEKESPLCNVKTTSYANNGNAEDNYEDEILQLWVYRLYFLLIHDIQHKHAQTEAKYRMSLSSCSMETTNVASNEKQFWNESKKSSGATGNSSTASDILSQRVPIFDYHCPNAKYLVMYLSEFGFGAHARNVFVAAFTAAILSGRTVLFLNNQSANSVTKIPWQWSSCERRDYQCVFLPTSPCTVTHAELKNATVVESKTLRYTAEQWETLHHDDRVVVIRDLSVWHMGAPGGLQSILEKRANDLVDRMELASQKPLPILRKSVEFMRTDPRAYNASLGKIQGDFSLGQVAALYGSRPNLNAQRFLEQEITRIFPSSYDPKRSLGLPIRGTDKCSGESECPGIDLYMDLATQQWNLGLWDSTTSKLTGSYTTNPAHLVLTSEDTNIVKQGMEYEANFTFPFSFVVNDQDISQGTGYAPHLTVNIDADEVILSTLLVIKMQLRASKVIGNCCSNFHNLIHDFIHIGCNLNKDAVAECMQDNVNEDFHLCCWDECTRKRMANEMKLAMQDCPLPKKAKKVAGKPILVASYPYSGGGFFQDLVTASTGLPSGEIYSGEKCKTGTVSICNTHWPTIQWEQNIRPENYGGGHHTRYIVLLRNPLQSLLSVYDHYHSHRKWQEWRNSSFETEIANWKALFSGWKQQPYEPALFVSYEKLLQNNTGPELLGRVLDEIEQAGNNLTRVKDLSCLWRHKERLSTREEKEPERNFAPRYTASQQSQMLDMLKELESEYANERDLKQILQEYQIDIGNSEGVDTPFLV